MTFSNIYLVLRNTLCKLSCSLVRIIACMSECFSHLMSSSYNSKNPILLQYIALLVCISRIKKYCNTYYCLSVCNTIAIYFYWTLNAPFAVFKYHAHVLLYCYVRLNPFIIIKSFASTAKYLSCIIRFIEHKTS